MARYTKPSWKNVDLSTLVLECVPGKDEYNQDFVRTQIKKDKYGLNFECPTFKKINCKETEYDGSDPTKKANCFFDDLADPSKPLTKKDSDELVDFIVFCDALQKLVFDFMYSNIGKFKDVLKNKRPKGAKGLDWLEKDMSEEDFFDKIGARDLIYRPVDDEGIEGSPVFCTKWTDFTDKNKKTSVTKFIGKDKKEIPWKYLKQISMTGRPKVSISNYYTKIGQSTFQTRIKTCVVKNWVKKEDEGQSETMDEFREDSSFEEIADFSKGFAELDLSDDGGEGPSGGHPGSGKSRIIEVDGGGEPEGFEALDGQPERS